MSDSLVIIPTYNEKENIEKIIRYVLSLEKAFHVLVVDDGSPDGTSDIVKTLMQEFDGQLHIQERSGKQGLGTAYIHGFKWGLERDYGYVFEMDADFSHNPDNLIDLYNACAKDGADMSVGSRYVAGGGVINWALHRRVLSRYASTYVRMVLGIKVKDTTAGYVCYTRKVLEKIDLNDIWFIGYAFQIEMKFMTLKHGFVIKEVPIMFIDRQEGVSKMSMSIFTEAFTGVWKMRRKKV
jgi:dolichol-phosphate mannosyltransferase